MAYFPNVREKIEKPLFAGTQGSFEPRENVYHEDNLDEVNKQCLWAYDYCVETVESALDDCDASEEVKESVLDYLEATRNEYVCSMIEGQS